MLHLSPERKRIKPKDFIVPVSGGKDSQTVLVLALEKHGKDHVRAVFQDTGYDHPDTFKHLEYMEERYQIKIERIRSVKYANIFDLIEKKGFFPRPKIRTCSNKMKQEPFAEWFKKENYGPARRAHVFFGMRTGESLSRKQRYSGFSPEDVFPMYDLGGPNTTKRFKHISFSLPIVDWTTQEVFDFLKRRGDRVNPLYDKGHSRVGCYPCLLADRHEWELAVRDPVGRQHIEQMVQTESNIYEKGARGNLRTIHETRDIRALLRTGRFDGGQDLFACFDDDLQDAGSGCAYCTF